MNIIVIITFKYAVILVSQAIFKPKKYYIYIALSFLQSLYLFVVFFCLVFPFFNLILYKLIVNFDSIRNNFPAMKDASCGIKIFLKYGDITFCHYQYRLYAKICYGWYGATTFDCIVLLCIVLYCSNTVLYHCNTAL